MRRPFYAIAALAVIAALLLWAFVPRAVPVETAAIGRRDLTGVVEAEGEARIREVVSVSAPIAGLLRRIVLHPGDAVAAGQVVASIGPAAPALLDARARAIAEATAAAAAAAVDLARAEVEQTAAALDFAQHEAARARTLFGRGALSERERDNAALAESTAVAAAASARAHLTVREKELESARAVIDSIVAATGGACCVDVVSPLTGRVLRVVTEDEQVLQVGTPILEVGDTADLAVVADVLSRDAVGMRVGADAVVTGWGGADLAARVDRIKPVAVTKVSALGVEEQRVDVELALRDAPPPELGHGFRVTARITVWQQSAALAVPIAALFRDGADWAVFAVQDGRAALRRIDLGQRNDDFAQVLGGLAEGDRVILHPDDTITSGTKLTDE